MCEICDVLKKRDGYRRQFSVFPDVECIGLEQLKNEGLLKNQTVWSYNSRCFDNCVCLCNVCVCVCVSVFCVIIYFVC